MGEQPAEDPEHAKKLLDLKRAKDLADAEKAALDAQRALEQARKTPDTALDARKAQAAAAKIEKELSDAQKAAADAAKAGADAAKAQADAELAAFKARFGDVPASPYKGDVTLSQNAGKTEALLLAAQAVKTAAGRIADAVGTGAGSVMLMAASELPTFDNLIRFRAQIGIVQRTFEEVERRSQEADANDPAEPAVARSPLQPSRAAGAGRAIVPPFAAAGLAVEAADKLLGFFKTDYTAGGLDVTIEDAALLNELAGILTAKGFQVYLPKVFSANDLIASSASVIGEVQDLALRNVTAAATAARHERLAGAWTERAAASGDAQEKRDRAGASERHTHAAEGLRNAITLYGAWFASLSSFDDRAATAPMAAVIRENALMQALGDGRSLLLAKLHASGGSYYTKKNIVTVFGGMPFFHMGGTVASYAFLNGATGAVIAAGTIPVHGGFVSAQDLPSVLKPGAT